VIAAVDAIAIIEMTLGSSHDFIEVREVGFQHNILCGKTPRHQQKFGQSPGI
jgi:hypothetical protein